MQLWYVLLFFFFSSRRRHTRSTRDWSSDVCSSDLSLNTASVRTALLTPVPRPAHDDPFHLATPLEARPRGCRRLGTSRPRAARIHFQIGRASCRERAYMAVLEMEMTKERAVDREKH